MPNRRTTEVLRRYNGGTTEVSAPSNGVALACRGTLCRGVAALHYCRRVHRSSCTRRCGPEIMVAPTFEGELQPSKPGLFLAPWTRTLVAPYCGFDLKGVNRRLELQLCARFVRPRGFVSLLSTAQGMEHGLSPFGCANYDNVFPAVPTVHHVIDRARKLHSHLSLGVRSRNSSQPDPPLLSFRQLARFRSRRSPSTVSTSMLPSAESRTRLTQPPTSHRDS